MRTFIAIDIEDAEIVNKLVEIQRVLKNTNAHLKLVEPENFHLTLKFLGEISTSDVEPISNIIRMVSEKYSCFTISLEGIGAFPTINKPRVIWVGIGEGASMLQRIASDINQLLRSIQIYGDDKAFHPHITLARVKRFNRELIRAIQQIANIAIGLVKVKSIRLKKSTLTSQGPIYTTLFEASLKSESNQ